MPLPSDSELYRLFDRSPIGMYRSNVAGVFSYVNAALAKLLGYSIEELLTKNLNTEIHTRPENRQKLIEKYLPVQVVDGAELEFRRKDGTIVTVQLWGHAVETPAGWSFDASVLDITEVTRQRIELEQTAKILERVVTQMPAIYWMVDHELQITRAGGAGHELLGMDNTFLGLGLEEIQSSEPSSVDPVIQHRRALGGETLSYDASFRGRQLAITIAPYRQPDGTIIGAIGTTIDVSSSRAIERRLVDAQRAESLGVLAGGLAHDFNNLLVAVIGNADLALREIPRGMIGRAAVENVRDAGMRAAELTHQLLTYAGRGGADTMRLSPATVVEEMLRIMAPTLPEEIAISAAIPSDLAVRADPAQLRQVVLNLVMNARDAIVSVRPRGTISVSATLVEHDGSPMGDEVLLAARGTYVLLEVTDDGGGMDDETRRHVFEPFFTTKQQGHGIGLAAVLGIVRAHDGGLRLRTSPDRGATFQVLWPAATSARMPTPPPQAATRVVLVIDDEDLVRDVVARMIEDLGYGTLTAADGATGIALVDSNSIDAVLVDLSMPRMNGRDVIAQLRSRRPTLPIILCSGYDRDGVGHVQADAYLPKPFRIDLLERTLAKLLPD